MCFVAQEVVRVPTSLCLTDVERAQLDHICVVVLEQFVKLRAHKVRIPALLAALRYKTLIAARELLLFG